MVKENWKTFSGEPIDDIVETVRSAAREGQTVHIGTDSLPSGEYTQFVTVVVVYTPGKGGRVFSNKVRLPHFSSLRERLMKEVWLSTELGLRLSAVVPGELIVISIDANPVVQFRSSQYLQELVGLVVGQGFKVLTKPDAFAASYVADHIVRGKAEARA